MGKQRVDDDLSKWGVREETPSGSLVSIPAEGTLARPTRKRFFGGIPGMPLDNFRIILGLPRNALVVYLVLWHTSSLRRKERTFKVQPRLFDECGVERRTRYRALESLEKAGLIEVERNAGQCPMVTLLVEGKSDPPKHPRSKGT